jgi:hypothetical protein
MKLSFGQVIILIVTVTLSLGFLIALYGLIEGAKINNETMVNACGSVLAAYGIGAFFGAVFGPIGYAMMRG